uniref:C-type lectin domain-containing protein n=1 Tax=Biomphalaria glabrata TaxID=6526 RepID=A0A2C9KXL5_BIOGL
MFSFLVVLMSALQVVSCIDDSLLQCNSSCAVYDFKYFVDKLLQQERELSTYQSLTNCSAVALQAQIEAIEDLAFYPSLIYGGKKYLIAQLFFQTQSSRVAITRCGAFGGYLAEIDDTDEYAALKTFINNTPNVNMIMISGSDAATKGTWLFQRTGQPVPVIDWAPNEPNLVEEENCLYLWRDFDNLMMDDACEYIPFDTTFMCEIPI